MSWRQTIGPEAQHRTCGGRVGVYAEAVLVCSRCDCSDIGGPPRADAIRDFVWSRDQKLMIRGADE
jgi:hypothetical protein